MITDRERAYFGGWTRREMAGGDHQWGDPSNRVLEVAPSAPSGLVVPPNSTLLQRGVPFYVVNTGSAACTVKRGNGTTIWVVTANSVATFFQGSDWYGYPIGTPQFGSVWPALTLTVDLAEPTANVDLLFRCVQQGYDGTQPVAVVCTVRSGVAIGTTNQPQRALTSGLTIGSVGWAAGSYWTLVVEPDAIVGGWGGNGGRGGVPGTGAAAGFAGQDGGQAVRTWIPMRVDCRGRIFGGGGGGGGGSSSLTVLTTVGGGGGGGRGANMSPGGVLIGSLAGGASPGGGPGTGGGAFSAGGGGLGSGNGGNAGNGGFAGQNGLGGNNVGNTANASPGGAGGAAISYLGAAGAPTILNGGANIIGGIVAGAT